MGWKALREFWKTPLFSRMLKIFVPILILLVFYFESNQALKNLDFTLLKNNINDLAMKQIIIIILAGICAVFPMVLYDFVLLRHLQLKVRVRETIVYSWTANTLSNFIGFGGIAGMMIRTFFYSKHGYEKKKLVKGIGLITLFYLSGMSLISWFPLIGIIDTPIFEEVKWIHIAILGLALYFPILIFIVKRKRGAFRQEIIDSKEVWSLAVISLLEWSFAFILIYIITTLLGISVPLSIMFATFIVASFAGIISMLPGGIGSFDLMYLLGMEGVGVPTETTLLILLLYRISYFIIPALMGVVALLFYFWREMNQKLNKIPSTILQSISHWIVTVFVLMAGIILLISAAIPAALERIKMANEILALPVMNMSHKFTVGLGISLLMLTRGIQYRVKWVYVLTLVTLLFAAVISLFKWFDYEAAIFISIVFIILLFSKKQFYRENIVPTWGKSLIDITGITVIIGVFIFIGTVNLPSSRISVPWRLQPYVITDSVDLFSSALIGVLLAILYMTLGYLLTRPRNFPFKKSIEYEDEIKEHLEKYEGTVVSHLIFLHDKYIFWNHSHTVMLTFQKYSDKLIVLSDLVGEKNDILQAMEEFHDRANIYGYTPVYYQVTSKMLPYLHENGYDFFKLGEEGVVNLPTFELAGKKMKNLRANKNKLEREGYHFQVVQPPYSNELFANLKNISDEWLDGRKEKGYSLGWFNPAYLNEGPIALVMNKDGEITAFSNVMPAYDREKTVSIDLMRYKANAANATMDYMFIKLFEWYKQQNYERFNLGMAPLANVGISKYSFLTEKIGYQIFRYGHAFYHFKGLKKFKEKYADQWEPKYLAIRKKASLPITMAQVSLLIARSGPIIKNKPGTIFSKFF